jgi:exopolysaccharide production protein ExoQ
MAWKRRSAARRTATVTPALALSVWFVLLLALLGWDPAMRSKTSLALWVPVIWIFIAGSRLPAQWLGDQGDASVQAIEEGNPIDRTVFFVLILLAISILISRSFKWSGFCARNLVLMAILALDLLSVCWSDFPLVTFKRWFRDLGNYLVVLIVLSDPHPLEAVRAVLRRVSYLLVPLSILLIKYYPQLGKQYDPWTGTGYYVGAATSKNMLGVVCLVSGLFFFWDTVTRWPERKQRRTKQIILVNLVFAALTLWLLSLANSATSRVCLVLGCLVIAAARARVFRRHPGFLKWMIPGCFCLYVILAFGFNINGELAGAVGRDPTLTDRTKIWACVLAMHTNPLVGTGYQTFWLGPRLEKVWQRGFLINEAHNGYLEVYLELGLIGVFLLGGFLISSYRNISRLPPSSSLRSLALAVWTVLVFYNMTEAAFQIGLPWMVFLLGTMNVAERAPGRVYRAAAFGNVVATKPLPGIAAQNTGRS